MKKISSAKNYAQILITQYFKKNTSNVSLDDVVVDKPNNAEIVISIDNIDTIDTIDENVTQHPKGGYNEETGNWHCLECGENMGDNPRQLCGKNVCYFSV